MITNFLNTEQHKKLHGRINILEMLLENANKSKHNLEKLLEKEKQDNAHQLDTLQKQVKSFETILEKEKENITSLLKIKKENNEQTKHIQKLYKELKILNDLFEKEKKEKQEKQTLNETLQTQIKTLEALLEKEKKEQQEKQTLNEILQTQIKTLNDLFEKEKKEKQEKQTLNEILQTQIKTLEALLEKEKREQQEKQTLNETLQNQIKTLETLLEKEKTIKELQLTKITSLENLFKEKEENALIYPNINHIPTIHIVYQYVYKNDKNVTGFGDFIRGCFFMLQFSETYNINVDFVINNHPIKKFLDYFKLKQDIGETISKDILFFDTENHSYSTVNGIIFYKYNNIDNDLFHFIKNSKTYERNKYLYLINHPNEREITQNHKRKIRTLFKPSIELTDIIETSLVNLELTKHNFKVIHIRLNDECFYGNYNTITKIHVDFILKQISAIKKNTDETLFLVASHNNIKNIILKHFPKMKTMFLEITHIADNSITNDNNIMNTLTEFYIMSYANYIYSFSVYDHGSGFSKWCSVAYNIPYICMSLK